MNLIIALALVTGAGTVDLGQIEFGPFPSAEECKLFRAAAAPGIEQMVVDLYSSGGEFTIYRSLDETPLRVRVSCE